VSILLPIVGTLAAVAAALARALAVDEIRGYIQRRITASVNATIELLPSKLQQEWADEWRAELSSTLSSPVAAARFALGLRRSALELMRNSAVASENSTEHRDGQAAKSERSAGVDFSDRRRQAALQEAARSMARAYEILSAQLGVTNLRGDLFMREAAICAKAGLIWKHGADYHDAIDPDTGEAVEIKSMCLREGAPLHFFTSRSFSPSVMERFRASGYWLFGVFDDSSHLIILYRVGGDDMEAQLAPLSEKTAMRAARGEPFLNNPKIRLDSIRPACTVVFQSPDFEEYEAASGRWCVRRRISGRVEDDHLLGTLRAAWAKIRRRR
jgi:hypothetical protein